MLDISKYPIKPNKALDQYFLVDEKILQREASLLELVPGDTVLEIGPGLGFLTRELVKKAKVIAIEKDRLLYNILTRELDGVELILGDALDVDLSQFHFNKFASNIPYSLSREITLKLLRTDFELGVIICQEEFAQKLVAKPGQDHYRVVSVIAQFYSEPILDWKVPRSAFQPQPPVASRIVLFRKRNPHNPEFEEFVKNAFSHRRKKFWNGKRPGEMSWQEFWEAFEEQR